MIRRPPRSTLFPYNDALPIFCPHRHESRSRPTSRWTHLRRTDNRPRRTDDVADPPGAVRRRRCRSEEHTSELQSHSDLVCRLLLEKKKTAKPDTHLEENIRQL